MFRQPDNSKHTSQQTRSSLVNAYLRPFDLVVLAGVVSLPLMLARRPDAADLVISVLVSGG
ncbi:MAG: hypothetical protein Alpg2KO_01380 [Alphaproteobacteria bacterium]